MNPLPSPTPIRKTLNDDESPDREIFPRPAIFHLPATRTRLGRLSN